MAPGRVHLLLLLALLPALADAAPLAVQAGQDERDGGRRPVLVLSQAPSETLTAAKAALCGQDGACVDARAATPALEFEVQVGVYRAVLAEGRPATAVADFAAASGTPVLRVAATADEVHPAFERPALVVLAGDAVGGGGDLSSRAPFVSFGTVHVQDVHGDELAVLLRAAADAPQPPAASCAVLAGAAALAAAASTPFNDDASSPLGLAMIVRDEGGTIARTADSALGAVDAWTIVDTGSKDDTLSRVWGSALARLVVGAASAAKFVDFAETRNLALRRHGAATAYVIMPDADFVFVGLWRLRTMAWRLEALCARASADVCGAGMKVVRRTPGLDVSMLVVFPTHALGTEDGWHYTYPVHEVASLGPDRGGALINVPSYVRMEAIPGVDPTAKSPARWRDFDLPTLRQASLDDPGDTRVAFYLARTLQAVDMDDEAMDAYARRIDMGGWFQEVFFSHYERGRILAARPGADPTPEFVAAAAIDPDRAEPYVALAQWHDERANACGEGPLADACRAGHRARGLIVARAALARVRAGLPDGKLFVLRDVYEWMAELQVSLHGYWLADAMGTPCAEGRALARSLARRMPDREPFAGNAKFFEGLRDRLGAGACGGE